MIITDDGGGDAATVNHGCGQPCIILIDSVYMTSPGSSDALKTRSSFWIVLLLNFVEEFSRIIGSINNHPKISPWFWLDNEHMSDFFIYNFIPTYSYNIFHGQNISETCILSLKLLYLFQISSNENFMCEPYWDFQNLVCLININLLLPIIHSSFLSSEFHE